MKILNNIKNFAINNTTFGRMYAFNESYGTSWVNAGKNSFAEISAYLSNYTIPGRLITKDESIFKSLGVGLGLIKTGEMSSVKTSVPRRCYE